MLLIDDFPNLTEEQKSALLTLFQNNPNTWIFRVGVYGEIKLYNTIVKHYSSDTPRFGFASPRIRYEVLENKSHGQGTNGGVFKSICTLSINSEGKLQIKVRKPDSARIAKIQETPLSKFIIPQTNGSIPYANIINITVDKWEAGIRKEWDYTSRVGYFKIKPMVQDFAGIVFVERYFPGIPMLQFYKTQLSIEEKFQFSVALIETYQEQIEKNNLVHCDLNPANILVDKKENSFDIKYIDLGLSEENNSLVAADKPFNIYFGAPPERTPNQSFTVTNKLDIFALGLHLAVLWKLPMQEIYLSPKMPVEMHNEYQNRLASFHYYFKTIVGIDIINSKQPAPKGIKTLVQHMCEYDVKQRFSSKQVIDQLQNLMSKRSEDNQSEEIAAESFCAIL